MRKIVMAVLTVGILVSNAMANYSKTPLQEESSGLKPRLSFFNNVLKDGNYSIPYEFTEEGSMWAPGTLEGMHGELPQRCEAFQNNMNSQVGQFSQLAQNMTSKGGKVSSLNLDWRTMCTANSNTYFSNKLPKEAVLEVMLWGISYIVAVQEKEDLQKAADATELIGTTTVKFKSIQDYIREALPNAISCDNNKRVGVTHTDMCREPKFRFDTAYQKMSAFEVEDSIWRKMAFSAVLNKEIWVFESFSKKPVEFVKYCKTLKRVSSIHDTLKKTISGLNSDPDLKIFYDKLNKN